MLLLCAGFLGGSGLLLAQDPENPTADPAPQTKTGETPGPGRFWQATLTGGNFMVALDRIASVSRAKYVLDGSLMVDEVTIDTVGQALARFYYITPISESAPGNSLKELNDRGKEMLDKVTEHTGVDVQNMVMKKYPETTHAKSIEYRIMSQADLTSLYDSVHNAWETGRGRKFGTAAAPK